MSSLHKYRVIDSHGRIIKECDSLQKARFAAKHRVCDATASYPRQPLGNAFVAKNDADTDLTVPDGYQIREAYTTAHSVLTATILEANE